MLGTLSRAAKGQNQSNALVFQAEMSEGKSESSAGEVDKSRLRAREDMQSSPKKSNDGIFLKELGGARLKTSTKR